MADGPSSSPGFGDVFSAFSAANPFPSIGKTFEQFRSAVGDFLTAVELFRKNMQMMNDIGLRVQRLLDQVEGPVQRVAPGLDKLASTLRSPVVTRLPDDMSAFMSAMADLIARLAPLGQLAETAGGMFGMGGLNRLASMMSPSAPSPAPAPIVASPPLRARPTARRATTGAATPASKRQAATRAPAKRAPAKKAATRPVRRG